MEHIKEDTYLNTYHEEMNKLLKTYFETGEYEKKINDTYKLIKPYLEIDKTAFYKQSDVRKGVNTLKKFSSLRTKSIRAQLDGKLPTNTENQKKNDKIKGSSIKIEDMGERINTE